jgi:hypothetical protein
MKTVMAAAAAVVLTVAAGGRATADPLGYQPKTGETFVYSRVIEYSDSDGHHVAKSELTLKVLGPTKAALTIKSHLGHMITRDVAIAPDGRWTFTDKNVPASNIAWYDPAFFGSLPKNVQVGQTWQAQVTKTEMFAGGSQTVKITSLSAEDATIATEGNAAPEHGQVVDPDSHKTYESFQQKRWRSTSTFHNGIETSFVRLERGIVRVGNAKSDDDFDVRVTLTSHTEG